MNSSVATAQGFDKTEGESDQETPVANQSSYYKVAERYVNAKRTTGKVPMSQISNPYSNMFHTFDPKRFFGRRFLREHILPGITGSEPRSFAISGLISYGKTSLLKYLCHPEGARVQDKSLLHEYRPDRPDKRLVFLYIDCESVGGETLLPTLYRRIIESGALHDSGALPNADMVSADAEISQIPRALENILKERIPRLRFVICLDNLDAALQSIRKEDEMFLRVLLNYAPLVIATERSLEELNNLRLKQAPNENLSSLSPLFPLVYQRQIGLLNLEEAKQLIEDPVREFAEEYRFSSQEVDFLLKVAGRVPFLLILACEYLFNLHLQDAQAKESLSTNPRVQQQVRLQMEALPGLTEHFIYFWNQLSEHEQHTLSKIVSNGEIDLEREQPALNSLRKKALIVEDLHKKPCVFSDLFAEFVRRQPLQRRGIESIAEELSPLDRKVFTYLLSHPNQVCTFEELFDLLWGDSKESKRGIESAIHRVRAKIQEVFGTDWEYIQNVRGKGYRYIPVPV